VVVKPELHANLQQYVGIPLNAVGRLMQILTIIQEGATGKPARPLWWRLLMLLLLSERGRGRFARPAWLTALDCGVRPGQLSVITTFLNFAGAWARVFTTLQEVSWRRKCWVGGG
jgi:hypothetical protein